MLSPALLPLNTRLLSRGAFALKVVDRFERDAVSGLSAVPSETAVDGYKLAAADQILDGAFTCS
jgi:hypothetical protein